MNENCIVTITGPSASGKSVLERLLVETGEFCKTVSTTTRPPRAGEKEGEDYYFVMQEDFSESDRNGEFIESVFFKGNGYAASKAEFERAFESGKSAVVVCEPDGAGRIRRYAEANDIGVFQLFVTNKLSVLVSRFVGREFGATLVSDDLAKYKVERLAGLVKEHQEWSKAHDWDMTIEWFGEKNQKYVTDLVRRHAASLSRGKPALVG